MRFSFGNFYGELQKRADVAGIGLTETVYPAHADLPLHAHESAYFCLVLKGSYQEIDARQRRLCRPAMLVFHPAGEAHANSFGNEGGACFNLEFGPAWMERISAAAPTLDAPVTFAGAPTAGLAARLRNEFHLMDNLSTLAIESLALELIVATARHHTLRDASQGKPPLWLKQAEEFVRARFAEPLTLNEIAAAINRHPVHLVRQFRRHHGCTIGDYIRRLRLESACHRLTTTDEPLVIIALACGFSGQAHFSTFFKRATGLSPARYREAFRAR
ncbi:MAG TPA: AraC family transcriptional regulator [Blastocatellia bacterium]|nr:AraC family transcriptional regulator [Blastocatellia bacterium]